MKRGHFLFCIGCLLFLGLSCTTPNEGELATPSPLTPLLLGQSDFPQAGKMSYRPPLVRIEDKGVRVNFDLTNGKRNGFRAVILRLTLFGPEAEQFSHDVYVGPVLGRQTKHVMALLPPLDFEPVDITVELLTRN